MPKELLTENEARQLYVDGDAAHDFDHVLRVARMAERIALAEGADLLVVRLAAYLHDVPVEEPSHEARLAHHLRAAQFARKLLLDRGMEPQKVENVEHCIQAHRFRDQSIQPNTLEAQCVYDADKLDSIGAIGVGRAFTFAGAFGHRLWTEPITQTPPYEARPKNGDYTPTHELVYKLQKLQDTLFTKTARQIGVERHRFMLAFFKQLDDEMLGLA